MRNRNWFRLYARLIDSPEILELDDREFRVLISFWCLASQSEIPGTLNYSVQALEKRLGISGLGEIIDHLKALDLLEGEERDFRIPRWEKHQYEYSSKVPRKFWGSEKEVKRKSLGSEKEVKGNSSGSEKEEFGKIDKDIDIDKEKEKELKEKEKALASEKVFPLNGSFAKFWNAYPRKRSRGQAEKAWLKLKPSPDLVEKILLSLERAKNSRDWKEEGGRFVPYPATWLNARGWEDEIEEVRNEEHQGSFGDIELE